MLFRRAAGILAAFLLIPPLLGASEVACPRHGDHHRPAATATEPTQGHEHHHQPAGESKGPSKHHPISDCCPAMSTCSGATAIQVGDHGLSLWSLDNEAPADVVTFSQSRVESPDPPPPKA